MTKNKGKIAREIVAGDKAIKAKIKNQIKEYREKILTLRKKLVETSGAMDTPTMKNTEKLNSAVMSKSKDLKTVLGKGYRAKEDRK